MSCVSCHPSWHRRNSCVICVIVTYTHARYQPCVFTAPGIVTQYVVALQHLRDNGDTYDQFVTLVRATCCVDPHRSFKHVWFLREFNQHDISLTKKVVWQHGIRGTHGMYKFVVPKPVFRDNLPSTIGLASPYRALRIINQHTRRVVISNYSSKCFGATGATFEFQDIKSQMFDDVYNVCDNVRVWKTQGFIFR